MPDKKFCKLEIIAISEERAAVLYQELINKKTEVLMNTFIFLSCS
jgi:hypothetical protein